ncbi:hypothetical protein L1887_15302 [Cichorium endivia]|nr:hypothetical protein L1887_15302 [Cichorium endivia]
MVSIAYLKAQLLVWYNLCKLWTTQSFDVITIPFGNARHKLGGGLVGAFELGSHFNFIHFAFSVFILSIHSKVFPSLI